MVPLLGHTTTPSIATEVSLTVSPQVPPPTHPQLTPNLGLTDLWVYSNNTWTWLSGEQLNVTITTNWAPTYGRYGVGDIASFPGTRGFPRSWNDPAQKKLWLLGGSGSTAFSLRDVFSYEIESGLWSWMGGPNDPLA